MRLYIDIDDTLIKSQYRECGVCGRRSYLEATPIQEEIDLVNKAYAKGFTIILFTGRGWDCFEITKKQVNDFGIKHHSLVMGKPDGIYIDKTNANTTLKGII